MIYINYLYKYPIISAAYLSTLIPIILLVTRKELSVTFRVTLFYLISRFAIDTIRFCMASHRTNNLILGNLSIITSFIFVSVIFYNIFINDRVRNNILNCILIYSLLFLFDFIFVNPDLSDLHNHKYVSFSLTLKHGIIIAYCLVYYNELLTDLYIPDLYRSFTFRFVSGVFLHSCVALFCSILYSSFFNWNFDKSFTGFFMFVYSFEVIMMVMIGIGVYKSRNNLTLH